MTIGLYDLLGVRDAPSPRDALLALWPTALVRTSIGAGDPDPTALGLMIEFLNVALGFSAVRPGAFPGGEQSGEQAAVGLTAELRVGPIPPPDPIVFAALPKIAFYLLETPANPARIYIRQTALGVEWIIEALPVEIRLPERLLMPLDAKRGDPVPLEAIVSDGFIAGEPDTLKVVLRRDQPSSIFTHVKLRMTEQFDFLIEPAIPLSIGPCRFSGIPSRGLHDLNFVLTPEPSSSLDPHAEALEWLRHTPDTILQFDPPGFITIRSLDLNHPASQIVEAEKKANEKRPEESRVEAVLEDLAIPGNALIPLPSHFTAGLRRALGPNDDPNGLYNLTDDPVVVELMAGKGKDKTGGLYLIVQQVLFQSVPLGADRVPISASQFAFLNLAISDDPKAQGISATIELTDEWTIEAGIHVEPPKHLFTLFNIQVKGSGLRAGVSFKRLFASDTDAGTAKTLFDAALLLGDLQIVLGSETEKETLVKVTPTSGKSTTVVVNDFGLRFGSFQIGSFWDPNATELKAAGVMRLSIDEFGFVTEPNGARYFSFSGSWPIIGQPSTVPATGETSTNTDPATSKDALGVQFHRLRWKIRGAEDAADFLIDGIGISLSYGTFALLGFGMLSDYVVGDVRFREAGIVLQVKARLGGTDLVIGGQFLHGRATGPSTDFKYILVGLEVSPIPIAGAIQLVNVRGLFAWNMTPDVGPAGASQPLPLFNWYKAHGDGVILPPSRNIAASGWKPQDNSYTIAVGAGVTLGGTKAVTIDAFFLYAKSDEAKGLLAALQMFLCKSKKPVAYAVVEIAGDRWSVLVGLALGFENVLGRKIPFLSDAPLLTGSIYATNQPATFAIGHLDDPSSWLALHIFGKLWVFRVELFAGMCLELVDLPEGPHVFALRVSFSGGSRVCAIGGIDFYLTLQIIAGVWRNESQVSGFVTWLEGGIDIDVLWVFQFGASVKLEWDYLGPDPAYRRIGCEVHIHTPWWMPDKTFSWNRVIDAPKLDRMATISTPVIEAAAHPLAQSDAIPVALSPLRGSAIDEQATFAIAELVGLTPPPWPPETMTQAVPVAIDSIIALHFKASVDDRLVFGQATPAGMGTQTSADVSTRYELVELGIRRRPRFGGGGWSDLIAPASSRTDTLLNVPPQDLPALFAAPFGMRWDADFQRAQVLDPRHLLLNAELPYLSITANLQNDENLVRNMPGWPCCFHSQKEVPWHTLDFRAQRPDDRVPRTQRFTESNSTLHWIGSGLPRVGASQNPLLGQIARLATLRLPETAFARVQFDTPAAHASIYLNWTPLHVPRAIVIAWFRGLKLLGERSLPLTAAPPGPLTFSDDDGITHILFRLAAPPVTGTTGSSVASGVEFISLGYQSRAEVLDGLVGQYQCGAVDPATGGNGARFAWLPNHDYEIAIRTKVSVKDERAGTLAEEVPQIIFFRTKGLPGLNATPRIGQEIEPYVESLYPAPGVPLYRSEPAALAFNERFDILQGLNRPPLPADPPERRQRLDWILAAELIAGQAEPARVTIPSADWIVAHRGTVSPPGPVVLGLDPANPILHSRARTALSLDPLRLRLDAALASPGSCDKPPAPPRKSRVLSHDPVDPSEPGAAPKRWPARAQLRMNLRVQGSPFVDRRSFDPADLTALTVSGGAWRVDDGVLGPVAGSGTQFAIFGDAAWTQFQLTATLDPRGGAAGIAIAVGSPAGSLEAWIDAAQRRLTIVARAGALETELASAPLPPGSTAPFALTLTAYDDSIRAQVGTSEVTVPRGERRAGRLALAARGAAAFASLLVDGLDAYRFEFVTSRFDDFAAHIGSFAGAAPLAPLAPPTITPAGLLAAGTDFDGWIAGLALPLRATVERLEIGIVQGGDYALLLIESPEPLPLGGDVSLRVFRSEQGQTEEPLRCAIIAGSRGSAALAVPLAADGTPGIFPRGNYRLEFRLDRVRYRAAVADGESDYRQAASVAMFVGPGA